MRILFTCPSFNIGGFSTHAINLSRALRDVGHQTSVLVTEPYGELFEDFTSAFNQVFALPRHIEGCSAYLTRFVKAINVISPDAIINDAVAFMQAAFPYVSPSIVKLSVIHSISESEIWLGVANASTLDRVIAVSKNIYSAVNHITNISDILMIPVGVNPTERHISNPPDSVVRLLYVGRVTKSAKNLPALEHILQILYARHIHFTLTVIGDGDYRQIMQANIARTPYAKQVIFEGALHPSEISSRLAQHHIIILTSIYEGTPHALLEAMGAGLVPIASRITGSTDCIIQNGINGFLCDVGDTEHYAANIVNLMRHPLLFAKLSEAARETIANHYTMNIICHEYLSAIEAVRNQPCVLTHSNPTMHATVSPELVPYCLPFGRQLRHKLGDYYRCHILGIRPVLADSHPTLSA